MCVSTYVGATTASACVAAMMKMTTMRTVNGKQVMLKLRHIKPVGSHSFSLSMYLCTCSAVAGPLLVTAAFTVCV